jgi:hypothetical protein
MQHSLASVYALAAEQPERAEDPTLESLLTDYQRSLIPMIDAGHQVISMSVFWFRLERCRKCPRGFWFEGYADRCGRCNDVHRACSKIRLWSPHIQCSLPAGDRQW